jgi:hypothetical protein
MAACRSGVPVGLTKAAVLAAIAATAKLSGLYLYGLVLLSLLRRDLSTTLVLPGRPRAWLVAVGVCASLPVLVL